MSASKSTSASVETLSTLERLILAQAAYEFGSNKWDKVATILSKHPLLHRSRHFYTPETCDTLFTALMSDAGLSLPDPENSRRAPTVLSLAQIHYVARVSEIKQLINEEETRFKQLVEEIDLIRSGKWDEKIRADLLGVPLTTPTPPAVIQPSEEAHITPSPAPTPGATELPEDSARIVEQMLAIEPLSTTSPLGEQPQVPVVTESQPSDPVPLPSRRLTPDESSTVKHAEVEEGSSEAQPASVSPAAARVWTPSPQPVEVVEEREIEESTERPPEEEDTQMEVDAEEAQADAGEEERSSSPQRAKTTPAPAEQDMEMERTSPDVLRPHEGKRKSSEALSETQRERKRLREESEPVDEEEPGPSTTKGRRKAQVGDKKFQNVIGMLHSTISQHRYGNIFHNPIKKSEAPDYSDLVKRPMDLKTIKARVKEGLITNSLEFQRDVYLMFANAMMYNRPGSEICAMAEEMMLESEIQINNFRQTEGFHHK